MAGLGFRRPQFSEDSAWLPVWLHKNQPDASFGTPNGFRKSSEPEVQASAFERRNETPLSGSDCRYNCRLFLSGDTASPFNSAAPCHENVIHLHLHLSSDSDTQQCSQTPVSERRGCISASVEVKNCQLDEERGMANGALPALIPRTYDYGGAQCDQLNARDLEEMDISDAVELSVAASEAMVIHEVVKDELELQAFPAASILEAALRMRQTRLEGQRCALVCSTEELDDKDFFSDLDDSAMMEAFDDVGIHCKNPDNDDVNSLDATVVKETPMLDNYSCSIGVSDGGVLVQQKNDKPAFDMMISCSADRIDPAVRQNSKDVPQVDRRERDDAAGPTQIKLNNRNCILKPYIREVSYFSESADVVPDENSGIQKAEAGLTRVSQPSVHLEGLCCKADEQIHDSQEVISSDQSHVDPLCSAVPCSIPSENGDTLEAPDQINVAKNCNAATSQRISDLEAKSGHAIGNCEISKVQQRIASMKTYSRLVERKIDVRCPDSRNAVGILPSLQNPKCTRSREREVNGSRISVKDLITDYDNFMRKSAKPTADGHSPHNLPAEENNEMAEAEEYAKLQEHDNCQNLQSDCKAHNDSQFLVRKQVDSSEVVVLQEKGFHKLEASNKKGPKTGCNKRTKYKKGRCEYHIQDLGECFTARKNHQSNLVFQGIDFLLTGFSSQNEKDIEELIRNHGGRVLWEVPLPARDRRYSKSNFKRLPIIISSRKLQTIKFLYGCAVNALILKFKWLKDSIAAGSVVQPERYTFMSNHVDIQSAIERKPLCRIYRTRIFHGVGIMLYGKPRFCNKLSIVVKHGGGCVYKTLHRLVENLDTEKVFPGVIVAENESIVSRHLRQCALERRIPIMPASWMVKSLHSGKLHPIDCETHDRGANASFQNLPNSREWSQEI